MYENVFAPVLHNKKINLTIDGGTYSSEDYEFISVYGMGVIIDGDGNVTNLSTPDCGMEINVKNVSYTGDRGIHSSNKNVTVSVMDSSITASGYSAFYIGGGTVCDLENVTVNCNDRGILAKSSYVWPDGNLYGTINIKSGKYAAEQNNPNWLLQKDDGCTMNVTGGSFSNDPSAFVAEGYKAVSETKEDGKTWYNVVPDDSSTSNAE